MGSQRRHEGYLMIDNRFGPGVSAEFVRRSGKDAPVVPAGTLYESATITCAHCHAVVILNPQRTRPRQYCARCDHYVCDTPTCATTCRSFLALLETRQTAAMRQAGG